MKILHEYTVLKNEYVVPVDVDGTLITHLTTAELSLLPSEDVISVYDKVEQRFIKVGINRPMVRLVKEEFSRGAHVIIWSRGGFEWAEAVIKAIELQNHVHQIMSKPLSYFDDLPVEDWLKHRVFLPPNTTYKR